MFAQTENLKRNVVGGLGAVLFGLSCLLAAIGPVQSEAAALANPQPAAALQA